MGGGLGERSLPEPPEEVRLGGGLGERSLPEPPEEVGETGDGFRVEKGGEEKRLSRQAHNLKHVGSNPTPAKRRGVKRKNISPPSMFRFRFSCKRSLQERRWVGSRE